MGRQERLRWEMGRGAMGRGRGRWRRAGKDQEWGGKGEAGGWTRRSGVVRGRQDWDNGEETGRGQWGGGDGEGAT